MNTFEINDIVKHFVGQANTMTVSAIFKKWLGSYNAAILFSQMLYWSNRTDEDGWFYKSYKQWETETYLTEKEARNVIEQLEKLDLIETKIAKVSGNPTKHFRVNFAAFQEQFVKFLEIEKALQVVENKGADGNLPKVRKETDQKADSLSSQNLLTKKESYACAGEVFTKNGIKATPLTQSTNETIETYIAPIRDFYGGDLGDEFRWGNACAKASDNGLQPADMVGALSSLMSQNRSYPITPENVYQFALQERAKKKIVKSVSQGLTAEEIEQRKQIALMQENYYARR